MNIGSLIARHARYRPDHLAFVFDDHRWSYRAFDAEVNRLSNAVLAAGLAKGDKVFAVLSNSAELMALYWMAAKTGIVMVPASPLLQAPGLKSLIADSDSVMVFADAAFAGMLDELRGDLPAVPPDRYVLVGSPVADGFVAYADFVAGFDTNDPPDAGLDDDDVFNIMYTSGTTGTPKGIVHTHYVRAHYASIFASSFRMTPESVVLHAGSIVFNGAMIILMPWMFVDCTYILHRAFDPVEVMCTIERERVTHMVMVPSQIMAILNHPKFDPEKLASLEMILSVGAPLLMAYKERLTQELPGRFYELYGVTEGFCTVLDCYDSMRKAGSVGVPPPFYELRILDDDGNQVATGEVGEICGRAPVLMAGYYKRPDLTEKAMTGGWLRTGDAGYVDEDGFLFLVDRIKDMIVSGSVNVYPKDVEEVLIRHPDVIEAAVFGIPDDKWGETPVAAVLLREGAEAGAEALLAWTNQRVGAKFQRLADLTVLAQFPRNVAGKTLKREIRERYLEDKA